MKRLTTIKTAMVAAIMAAATPAMAQSDNFYGLGNRVGIGVGVGTEGIGIDAAVPLTKYVQARVGVNFIPNININANAEVTTQAGYGGQDYDVSGEMKVKGKFSRTTFDVKFDCYPFANSSSFFVTAGLSFGGSDLIKISGQSEDLKQVASQTGGLGIEIGDYVIPIDRDGSVHGGVKVNSVRPYLGLGFGRLIPKKRFGVRFELGAQFQGTPKVYADGVGDLTKIADQDTSDDISKFMDYLKVYPVLKLSLRGRIL